ncbi:heme NO-binding domain-containing protein [Ruegeria sp. 2012CJ41-6]|uniref:Heme NO-binding domain-containing protein n=1 Tax=Ruegeria spongiae TaxID=2942209 RepID=A0ABT0Q2W3_9RHOB|nr:heme NO-binding domain-containing protein [Ruegeria spongiae]MCL6283947.1 heme NO-binding domain-containing protein [Ruegeria spongiae]
MHGLINRAIQSFICHNYGRECWLRVTEAAELGFVEFEPMLVYENETTDKVLVEIVRDLGRNRRDLLEDLGTYLVSNPNTESLRRLLRFGGVTYVEFLHSLDDLPDRARMAVSDLTLPALELREYALGHYTLTCQPGLPGYADVMTGMLRTMADDYGALAILDHKGATGGAEIIEITLIESSFAEGRSFELGARAG